MLNHALKLLNKGLSIVPVSDKIPLVNWTQYQKERPKEEDIKKWWSIWPNADIGIITGKISNLSVVDVENGGSVDGLPETLIARSGGGGFHYYYKYMEGVENKVRVKELTDIRSEGGIIVAPPSSHKSGGKYEWLNTIEPQPFPIEFFGGMDNLNLKTKINMADVLNGVGEGSRNDIAARIIGKLIKDLPETEWNIAWTIVSAWNSQNKPPLPELELREIYKSITSREKKKPEVETGFTLAEVLKLGKDELISTNPKDVISFGYDFLDNKLTGLFKGELLIIGGETGTGKTTLATNMVYRASKKVKTYIFALEDRLVDYGIKALYFEIGRIRRSKYNKANYPWNDYRKNTVIDPEYQDLIEQATTNLKNENIEFFPSGNIVDIDVVCKMIELKHKQGVELFLVDHLHYFDLLKGDSSKADYIEHVMVRLKTLQNKLGVRIIMVVHYKKLDGKRPALDSFKDSISIVQNATYVINLWRDRSEGADHYKTKLACPKSRNPNGEFTLDLEFDPMTNDYKMTANIFGSGDGNVIKDEDNF